MKLKLAKCKFRRSEIQFLGHIINHEGIRTLPEKTEEISKIKAPRKVDKVRAFLGVLNYYCRFIPAFSDLMHPIQKLLKKNIKFEWMEECNKAFRTAKETLIRDPILYHPDPNTPWITDSAYKYAFTLIDMLTNYVFVMPVKDICNKTLVHEYIYKDYLLGEWRNFFQTMAPAS